MRKYQISIATVLCEDGNSDPFVVNCDDYSVSRDVDKNLFRFGFVNGVDADDNEDDPDTLRVTEMLVNKDAFVSMVAMEAPESLVSVSATELARLREIAESVTSKEAILIKGNDDAGIQALANEAEAGYNPDKLIPPKVFGTENLFIARDNH